MDQGSGKSSWWHPRPLKSRREYITFSFFSLLWIYSFSKGLFDRRLDSGEHLANVMLLLGWGCLLAFAVHRRLLYLGFSPWWGLPIVAISFGATTLLTIFAQVQLWILPLIYFVPQVPLITGKTEEPHPRPKFPFPRVEYTLKVLVLVDLPFSWLMQTPKQFWVVASVCGPVMVYLTAGRFRDIGFAHWSALPYTLIALSPYLQFYLRPGMSRWSLVLAAIVLQTPAMFLRKRWVSEST